MTLMPHAPILLVATSVNVTLDSLGVDSPVQVGSRASLHKSMIICQRLDINECENATEICDSNATCSDTQGSYECMCNTGYSGDGLSCTSEFS